MKRKHFLKALSMSGLALHLLPARSVFGMATTNTHQLINIHSVNHVRHGLLTSTARVNEYFPQWIAFMQKETYFRNGFNAGKGDLTDWQLKMQDKFISIKTIEDRLWMNDVHVTKLDKFTPGPILLEKGEDWSVQFMTGKICSLKAAKESVVVPMTGNCQVNNAIVKEGKGYWMTGTADLVIESNEIINVLIINKLV